MWEQVSLHLEQYHESDLYSECWASWCLLMHPSFFLSSSAEGEYVLIVGLVGSLVVFLFRWRQRVTLPAQHRVIRQHTRSWGILLQEPGSSMATDTKTSLSSASRGGLVGSFPCRAALCLSLLGFVRLLACRKVGKGEFCPSSMPAGISVSRTFWWMWTLSNSCAA